MLRPCFLVVDREQAGNISTRKLVIETAKFNVITAYSAAEALESLQKFPGVDGVVLDPGVRDMPCSELIRRLKAVKPELPIVAVGRHACEGADHQLESFDPTRLLILLQQLQPDATATLLRHDEQLAQQAGQL